MTKREEILQAIKAALTGVTGVPDASVFRSRVEAFSRDECPALLIEPLNDVADSPTVARTQWSLTFHVSVIVRADVPDQEMDEIIKSVHQKIMTDAALQSKVVDLVPLSVDWARSEADMTQGAGMMKFKASYQTDTFNLSA